MHFGASGRDRRPCDAVVLVSWVLFTCKRHLSHPFSSLNPAPNGSATSQEDFSRRSAAYYKSGRGGPKTAIPWNRSLKRWNARRGQALTPGNLGPPVPPDLWSLGAPKEEVMYKPIVIATGVIIALGATSAGVAAAKLTDP